MRILITVLIAVFTMSVLVYSLMMQGEQSFQIYQKDDIALIEESKKVESTILEQIFKNESAEKLFSNPQDSGIIILDYFNELIQEIAAESSIYDLIGFSIGMVIYGIFVYHFYRLLSKRDMFSIGIEKKISQSTFKSSGEKISIAPRIIGFISMNFFIFPFVIFLWFIGYSAFMFLLVQSMPTSTIFLVSSGLIIAVRISCYYSEDLARDIAKLLPFALLGIFLFNPEFYSFSGILERLTEMPAFVIQIASFMILVIVIETILSTLYLIKIKFFHKEKEVDANDEKAAV